MFQTITEAHNKILKLFSCANNKDLANQLDKFDSNKNIDDICGKEIEKIGGWKCTDCDKNPNSIVCHHCWSKMKDKHINHNILFNCYLEGGCDCGDENMVKTTLFCPNHKGYLKNEKEIENYINSILPKNMRQNLEQYLLSHLKEIFPLLIEGLIYFIFIFLFLTLFFSFNRVGKFS